MRRFLGIVLLLIAVPLIAQPQHQTMKIEFRSRVPSSILLSQSGLSENGSYSDEDLQVALGRLRRLPFVYNASYTIEGSTVTFDVSDEHYFFYNIDSQVSQQNGRLGGNGGFFNGVLGGRYYAPWGGTVQGTYGARSSEGDHGATYTIQYAQYGIGSSRLFFVLGVAKPTGGSEGSQPRYTIGYPITLRQTITFTGFRTSSSDSEPSGQSGRFTSESTERDNELAWHWDTTNDPVFTSQGAAFLLGYGKQHINASAESTRAPGVILFSSESVIDFNNLHGAAQKFWPVGRGSVFANVDTVRGKGTTKTVSNNHPFNQDQTQTITNALVGYAYNFFPLLSQFRDSRHRLEVSGGVQNFRSENNGNSDSTTLKNVRLGYAYRNRWGNFRFVMSWLTE